MNNQRGSAIVLVMMMMTILALAGAGLLLQSRMDTRLTRSQLSYDRTANLADGASKVSLAVVKISTTDMYKYSGQQNRQFVAEAGGGTSTGLKRTWDNSSVGYWDSYMTLCGFLKQAPPGWEIGQYSQQYWVVEGTGSPARAWVTTPSPAYVQGSLVACNGSTYVFKSGGTNVQPGTGVSWANSWDVVAPNQTIVHLPILKITRE